MELKVWVEGTVRVVCGLSLETSCQDVVIALAQAIGQTGRYVLIEKLRGTERQLLAHESPLESLFHLGQPANEVQFVLRRTGPASSDRFDRPIHPLPRHSTPEPPRNREPKKALSFNLGPSTIRTGIKASKAWKHSPRASPELRASPNMSLVYPTTSTPWLSPSDSSKEDIFRKVLQQQERLQDLEAQLAALEREAEVWEMGKPVTPVQGMIPDLVEQLDVLERWLKQNEAELMYEEYLEQQIQREEDKEQELHGRLLQLCVSMDDNSFRLQDLQANSSKLGQELNVETHRQSSHSGTSQPDEALEPLQEELHCQIQQGTELEKLLTETARALTTAEEQMQERCQELEDLNKELRQCNLQQFILQTGVPPAPTYSEPPHLDQKHPYLPPTDTPYLCNTGLLEDNVTVC
ncbi:ras association domain-containing protein 7 [Esox lucius]|uniref:Ras-associating domain-containing protein n=1 Tax=Esox lucius TaxID=8010 RepID=A0A3P8YY04_ESOLU|nr:ras association domain-containing protein 7 [Esox lucius]XP_019899681.2 ras association domain-containing protein 7 [Esox lucius]XP_019899682.2 ras association domain-containing protein 7 [Esox lucius]